MATPTEQFHDRTKEIDLYFDFLRKVVVDGASLGISSPSATPLLVDPELQKMLKANAIVLLYNLIESSVRNGLVYIYDDITAQGHTYKVLRDEIQVLWLDHWIQPAPGRTLNSASQKTHELIRKVLKDEIATFNVEKIPIQGNLDAKKIRELSKKYGFSHTTTKKAKGGALLVKVKEGRNELAHGRKSFAEYGRDLTFPNLQAMKSQVVLYMQQILRNMETFVEKKEYILGKSKQKTVTA
jgi:MAE_28990/MAE_18760-like HEPN